MRLSSALPVERENWQFVRAHTELAAGENDLMLQNLLVDIEVRCTGGARQRTNTPGRI
jgi:hypothetical protein